MIILDNTVPQYLGSDSRGRVGPYHRHWRTMLGGQVTTEHHTHNHCCPQMSEETFDPETLDMKQNESHDKAFFQGLLLDKTQTSLLR